MALDPAEVTTPFTPAWWMDQLSKRLLAPDRMQRLATLQAYADNRPPMITTTDSQRRAFYSFCRMSRMSLARSVVRSRTDRMQVRAIRTAAAGDDRGDAVAWRYWTSSGLEVAAPDVHTDLCTLGEAYVRVMMDPETDLPFASRRDPRYCITAQDPLNPLRTIAAFELVWDEWAQRDYAYLWLPGEQWVAERDRKGRPTAFTARNTTMLGERLPSAPYWKLSFTPTAFTMRPLDGDVAEADRDGGPYSQVFTTDRVPVVRFLNRNGRSEFEDALDSIDRVNQTIMQRLVTMAVQAYKQRALVQDVGKDGKDKDRLPDVNPKTNESIDWDEVFQPGPDALWKLPPGVQIWESQEVQVAPMLQAETDSIRQVGAETNTPLPLLSDSVNESAEGAQLRREGLVFTVEDLHAITGRGWAQVESLMFAMAPDEDRYAEGPDGEQVDRSDAGQIVLDWAPAERYSLAEKADADSKRTSLSQEMGSVKIWGLTPAEAELNAKQLRSEAVEAASVPAAAAV